MGKECGAWVSRRLWGGGNTSPLKTTAWEASMETGRGVEHSVRSSLLHSNINCTLIYLIIVSYSLVILIVIMFYILL